MDSVPIEGNLCQHACFFLTILHCSKEDKCEGGNIRYVAEWSVSVNEGDMAVWRNDVCLFMHCRGYGYVQYETYEMAQTAVERMNNVSFHGSNLQVSWVSVIVILSFVSVLKRWLFGFDNRHLDLRFVSRSLSLLVWRHVEHDGPSADDQGNQTEGTPEEDVAVIGHEENQLACNNMRKQSQQVFCDILSTAG